MIYVNARFLTQSITGVQRFSLQICRALQRIDGSIRFVCPEKVMHDDLASELGAERVGKLSGHLWEQIELPFILNKIGKPLLLSLGTMAPVSYRRKIVTVHDLAFIHFPDAVSVPFRVAYKTLIPKIIEGSLHLTTVSQYSRDDIIKKYNPSVPVDVIYNAASEPTPSRIIELGIRREPFILAVGSLQPYKNLDALVRAFILFKSNPRHENFRLVIAGGADRSVYRKAGIQTTIGGRTDVDLLGYVSDERLSTLYQTASAFVFPSLFEGFGIPPLEAMAHSCPVLASTAASIPEVCSDGALYFDPLDVGDMASKMSMIMEDEFLRKSLVQNGILNLERFGWDKSARRLLQIAQQYSNDGRQPLR